MERYLIKTSEVKTLKETAVCSKCGGELKFTGLSLTTYPCQNEHVCETCGDKFYILDTIYPRIVHKTIGDIDYV